LTGIVRSGRDEKEIRRGNKSVKDEKEEEGERKRFRSKLV